MTAVNHQVVMWMIVVRYVVVVLLGSFMILVAHVTVSDIKRMMGKRRLKISRIVTVVPMRNRVMLMLMSMVEVVR